MNSQKFDEESLTSSLKLLAEEMETLNAPPEVEEKLRAAFRQQRVVVPMPNRYSRYWLVAAAAMILIVIGVIAFRSRTEPPKPEFARQIEQPQIKQQTIVEEPKVDHSQPEPQRVAQKQHKPAKRRVPRSEVANHMNREIATDFMPLGYLNPATLQDGGQIVRVEVPRSALVNFGLPVNMDRYHEKVKADVLLGVDGLAHAIRFVKNQ
jgi:hypothetical protein